MDVNGYDIYSVHVYFCNVNCIVCIVISQLFGSIIMDYPFKSISVFMALVGDFKLPREVPVICERTLRTLFTLIQLGRIHVYIYDICQ